MPSPLKWADPPACRLILGYIGTLVLIRWLDWHGRMLRMRRPRQIRELEELLRRKESGWLSRR